MARTNPITGRKDTVTHICRDMGEANNLINETTKVMLSRMDQEEANDREAERRILALQEEVETLKEQERLRTAFGAPGVEPLELVGTAAKRDAALKELETYRRTLAASGRPVDLLRAEWLATVLDLDLEDRAGFGTLEAYRTAITTANKTCDTLRANWSAEVLGLEKKLRVEKEEVEKLKAENYYPNPALIKERDEAVKLNHNLQTELDAVAEHRDNIQEANEGLAETVESIQKERDKARWDLTWARDAKSRLERDKIGLNSRIKDLLKWRTERKLEIDALTRKARVASNERDFVKKANVDLRDQVLTLKERAGRPSEEKKLIERMMTLIDGDRYRNPQELKVTHRRLVKMAELYLGEGS